jgi:ABC-type transport system involved in cytochrome bd biosynthesis fused ATPase/permease subunit
MSLSNEEMLKLSCETQKLCHKIQQEEKQEKEKEEFMNRLFAIMNIAALVSVVIASVQMLMSNDGMSIIIKSVIAIFACTMTARHCFQSMQEIDMSFDESISDLMIQLLYTRIDEEGRGYISDLKSEWIKFELSQNQIKIKELMFIIDHYWGRFIAWMQLPRFSTFTRTR